MPRELIVPCRAGRRIRLTITSFTVVSASSWRMYKRSGHAAGSWIVALYSVFVAVLVCRLLFTKRFVFSDKPKSIQYELRFAGVPLKGKAIDPTAFNWVRSRSGSFEPRDTIIELGMEHSYDAVTVQTIKYAMGETQDVIKTRSEIANILAINDRGHERLPLQRTI